MGLCEACHGVDIPKLHSVHCFSSFKYVTQLVAENAAVLAAVFQERAPWCNYEPSLPFTALDNGPTTIEALTIVRGTGNNEELEVVDLSALVNLHSLHIEERCFLYAKQFIVHDLQFLKSIRIERLCFLDDRFSDTKGGFFVNNCPQLDSIFIGGGSFSSCSDMELEGACERSE